MLHLCNEYKALAVLRIKCTMKKGFFGMFLSVMLNMSQLLRMCHAMNILLSRVFSDIHMNGRDGRSCNTLVVCRPTA